MRLLLWTGWARRRQIAVYSIEFGGYRVVPTDLSRHFDSEGEAEAV